RGPLCGHTGVEVTLPTAHPERVEGIGIEWRLAAQDTPHPNPLPPRGEGVAAQITSPLMGEVRVRVKTLPRQNHT
ncbi:MAG TPA: hypothetical protein VJA25_04505, partial [Dehalococcoidia bacterium]|nr:hypothetical protein [Dehalococcoidia bacterium]